MVGYLELELRITIGKYVQGVCKFEFGCLEKKNDLIYHHDFRKYIALALINPIYVRPLKETPLSRKKGRDQEDGSVVSSVTISTIQSIIRPVREVKRRATLVNDTFIASTSALSRLRLDPRLDHILDTAKGSAMCSLHRCVGIELERNAYYYQCCNVNLCIVCNIVFSSSPRFTRS